MADDNSWPTLVGQLDRQLEILNMFNTGSRPTIMKSVVESVYSRKESSDSIADSTADSGKVSVWVRALRKTLLEAVFGSQSPSVIILMTSFCAMVSIMT